jgi:ABC-type polar amino acid transport system ATPase subunit
MVDIPTTGNQSLPPPRQTGDPQRDIAAVIQAFNNFYQHFAVAQNVYGQLADIQTRLAAVEADIVAIKNFVGMPP